ncbi:Zinc finger C-x8-C-x5-C-x3-H type (and similar) [Novymonas esmeraldas]|uniref:Zinc finger C-x8-C-x5-C-x3-H type (And similar) n=1 Tax=Novymonas esmeraldas TaxID=1808958 RepID=A0AAW0EKP4_9TRYP
MSHAIQDADDATGRRVTTGPLLFDDLTDYAGDVYGVAAIQQILRDAIGTSTCSPAGDEVTLTPATQPALSIVSPQRRCVVSERDYLAVTTTGSKDTSPIAQVGSHCEDANERSSDCAAMTSVGYPEGDASPSWQSLSKPDSLSAAVAPSTTPSHKSTAKHSGSSSGDVNAEGEGQGAASSSATSTLTAVAPSKNAASHYKTKRCRHFDQSGWCPYQHRCVFAHGDREFALYMAHKSRHSAAPPPTASQLVREPVDRDVQELIAEYEQAVAEAAAKRPGIAKSQRDAQASNSGHRANRAAGGSRAAPPPPPPPPPPPFGSVVAHAYRGAGTHARTGILPPPPPPPPMMAVSSTPTAVAPQPHYHMAPQHPYALLGQPPLLFSFMNGDAPVNPSLSVVPPSPSHLAASHHPSAQPIVFAMQAGGQPVYHVQQQQQQQQQQLYVVSAPFLHTVSTGGAAAGLPSYPTGTGGGAMAGRFV